jgi:hypothetical protein
MQKLLLISILIMSVAIPVATSRDRSRKRAVRQTITWVAAYCVVYLIALLYIYPRLEGY